MLWHLSKPEKTLTAYISNSKQDEQTRKVGAVRVPSSVRPTVSSVNDNSLQEKSLDHKGYQGVTRAQKRKVEVNSIVAP